MHTLYDLKNSYLLVVCSSNDLVGEPAKYDIFLTHAIGGYITQTRPCNIQQYFTAVKILIFRRSFLIFFLFLLKTLIEGRGLSIKYVDFPCNSGIVQYFKTKFQ